MQKKSDSFTFWLLAVLSALSLLCIVVVLLTSLIGHFFNLSGGEPRILGDRLIERVKPVGRLNDGVVATKEVKVETPKEIVDRLCSTCHKTGLNGAPVMGDEAAWAERFDEQGFDGLKDAALHGFNNGLMPAKGGDPSLSDEETIGALMYQLIQSGLRDKLEAAGVDTSEIN